MPRPKKAANAGSGADTSLLIAIKTVNDCGIKTLEIILARKRK
jgi:hypothetical protein